MKNGAKLLLVFILIGFLCLSFVSANWLGDFFNKITGNVIYESTGNNLDKSIGVDYHAVGPNFISDSFLVRYQDSNIRSQVLSQLDQMKDSGVTDISTRIWLTHGENEDYGGYYHHHFPLTTQEFTNLRQYVRDVADRNFTLSLILLNLWCADYNTGSPSTRLGASSCSSNSTQFIIKYGQVVNGILENVRDIKKSDGSLVVDRLYMSGEVLLDGQYAKDYPNTKWFFRDSGLWNWFYTTVSAAGIKPTTYFQALPDVSGPLISDDSNFPQLNGHWSMERVYRSVKWMKDNNLPLPDRIDFDVYSPDVSVANTFYIQTNQVKHNSATTIKKVLDDFEATIPPLLGKSSVDYYIMETGYFTDEYNRYINEKSWKENLYFRKNLKGVNFWTTPYTSNGDGKGLNLPFNFNLFLNNGKTGLISSNATICNVDSGKLSTVKISWHNVEQNKIVFITVKLDNGEELLFACATLDGSQIAPWIQADKNYTFSLYAPVSWDSSLSCSSSNLLTTSNKILIDKIVVEGKIKNDNPGCTYTYSDWSACSSSGKQTKTLISQTPTGCTGTPDSLIRDCNYIPLIQICTSFTYSSWGECNSSGYQNHTVLSALPAGCSGGSPELIQTCNYIPTLPLCTENDWSYTIYPSVCPSTGEQTKTWIKSNNCFGGISHLSSEVLSCEYIAPVVPTCNDFTYSSWSQCNLFGEKTRTVTSQLPENCIGGNPSLLDNCLPPCTENDWVNETSPSICLISEKQIVSWSKIGNCNETSGVNHVSSQISCEYIAPVVPTCTYTYSDWNECSSSNVQIRSVLYSSPDNCQGAPDLSKPCNYIPTCVAENWIPNYGECQQTNLKSVTYTKIGNCIGPEPLTDWINCEYSPNVVSVQCNFTYSDWGECLVSGIQKREIALSNTTGCIGTPELNKTCDYLPLCNDNDWQSLTSPSICPVSGNLTKNWTKIGHCNETSGVNHSLSEVISCEYDILECSNFSYSDWSQCLSSGVQTRFITNSGPDGCQNGNPELKQNCTYTPRASLSSGGGSLSSRNSFSGDYNVKTSDNYVVNSVKKNSNEMKLDTVSASKSATRIFFVKLLCRISNLFNTENYSNCIKNYIH